MEHCIVQYAGGMDVSNKAAIRIESTSLFIHNSTIRDNQSRGIAIWDSSEVKIDTCTIQGNTASDSGGGVYASNGHDHTTATITIINSTIQGNTASGSGGGIYADSDGFSGTTLTIMITNSTIQGNTLSGSGGGIYADSDGWSNTIITITDSVIQENTSSGNGGEIYAGIRAFASTTLTITNSRIQGNTTSGEGGGIYTSQSSATITNSIIQGNTAWNIAAIRYSGDKDFIGNLITQNTTTGSKPTYTVYISGHPNFNQNDIYGNIAGYELYNGNDNTSALLNVTNNYWGITDEFEILSKIYSFINDQSKGMVEIKPWLDSPVWPVIGAILKIKEQSGYVGDEIEVSGAGFEADEQVSVKLGSEEVLVKAADDGSFTVKLKVPMLYGGKHVLSVEGSSGQKVEKQFEVKSRLKTITPSEAPVGSTIKVIGDGFAPNARVSVMIGGESTSVLKGSEANSNGELSVDVVVPGVKLGTQELMVSDGQSEAKNTIQVIKNGEPTKTCVSSEFKAKISLTQGVNMISLPLSPAIPYTASTLADALNSTIVIQVKDGLFDAYVHVNRIGNDFDIQMGKGYIVNLTEAQIFEITGKPWGEPVPVAPSISIPAEPWAFVIAGQVEGEVPEGGKLLATNRRTKESIIVPISTSGQFTAAFVDMSRKSVVVAGDELITQIISRGNTPLTEAKRHIISREQIANAYLLTNLSAKPEQNRLLQNYPNPFNPETWIPFQLAEPADVTIHIFGQYGRKVRSLSLGRQDAGMYVQRDRAAYWDGKNEHGEKVASGVYFYVLNAGQFQAVRKLCVVK